LDALVVGKLSSGRVGESKLKPVDDVPEREIGIAELVADKEGTDKRQRA
jgi:hypothetical protein